MDTNTNTQSQSRTNPSFATIDIARLKHLPIYKMLGTYHLQETPGNGCHMDPPGYPSYFTRSVYTQFGNTPSRGVQMVISYQGVDYVFEHANDWEPGVSYETYRARINKRLRSLWKALPIDHPRTVAWIADCYKYFQHCYIDPATNERVIYPVPYYEQEIFVDKPSYNDDYRADMRAQVNAANNRLFRERMDIATIDNHNAVVYIRKYYPDYQPTDEQINWIENPPAHTGNWYETADTQPSPEDCPGQYGRPHPVNNNWCQWCGWKQE